MSDTTASLCRRRAIHEQLQWMAVLAIDPVLSTVEKKA